ncbi:unnamed protein product, partial [Menidia menidia]
MDRADVLLELLGGLHQLVFLKCRADITGHIFRSSIAVISRSSLESSLLQELLEDRNLTFFLFYRIGLKQTRRRRTPVWNRHPYEKLNKGETYQVTHQNRVLGPVPAWRTQRLNGMQRRRVKQIEPEKELLEDRNVTFFLFYLNRLKQTRRRRPPVWNRHPYEKLNKGETYQVCTHQPNEKPDCCETMQIGNLFLFLVH